MLNQDYLIFAIIVFAVVLIGILVLVLKSKKQDNKKITIDEDFIDKLINYLGGKDNIKNIEVELRRVKLELVDIDSANFDELKTIGASGAFISGNSVKVMFEQAPEDIVESIKIKCGL